MLHLLQCRPPSLSSCSCVARGGRKFRDDASGAPTKQSSYLLSSSCGGHLQEYLWPPPFSLALSLGGSVALNPWSAQGAEIKFFWWGAWTSPSKVQTSRGNLHLSESDWGEFLLKFDLGPHVASLCQDVHVPTFWGGGCASFGMNLQGPLPRPLISGAPCSNKDTSRRSRSKSQGQDNAREDKTGQHKTRQDWTGQENTRQDRARQDWPRSTCQEKDQT